MEPVLLVAGALPFWASILVALLNLRKSKGGQGEGDTAFKEGEGLTTGVATGGTEALELEGEPIEGVGEGLPKGLRRLWGLALLLCFLTGFLYGSNRLLAFLFKEYRWVIGTTYTWGDEVGQAVRASSALSLLACLAAALRTGVYFLKE